MNKQLSTLFMMIMPFVIWQFLVWQCAIPEYILPSPLQVGKALIRDHHLILRESMPTLLETLLGLLIGIFIGSVSGLLLTYSKTLAKPFLPLLIVSQAIPTFAIAPLLVIWFGFGLTSKIMTSIIMIFFPVTSAFYDGLQRTPVQFLELAQMMNAPKWRIFLHLRIPAALPALASGIRVATVIAPIGAIVGEWVGASKGLGYLMINANARMQIDQMFAALFVLIVLALSLYYSIDKLLQRWIWWSTP